MTFRGGRELALSPRGLPLFSSSQVSWAILPGLHPFLPTQGLLRAGTRGWLSETIAPSTLARLLGLCVDKTVCPDDGGRGRGTKGTVGAREPHLSGGSVPEKLSMVLLGEQGPGAK